MWNVVSGGRAGKRREAMLVAAVTPALMLAGVGTPVQAEPTGAAATYDAFYDTSTVTAGAPGTILRIEETALVPVPGELDVAAPMAATKVMYSTVDQNGAATPVTGYMVEPSVPWAAGGERPTVVIGRGTIGQGDQCAPSKNWPIAGNETPLDSGRTVNLEGLYDFVFAGAGVRVFVTDYVGMGTPGMHTYMNRADQSHAMLDGARAAQALSGEAGPVGFYGHSQGGGASAAAVEEAVDYAPELNVVGAYASAPPADLDAVQRGIEGSDLVGAIAFTVNGLNARYPELDTLIDANLSDHGRDVLTSAAQMCTDEITEAFGGQTTREWISGGRSLAELLEELPAGEAAMNDQLVGTKRPVAPVMVVSGRHDDTVDYQQGKDLADRWWAMGGEVIYRDDVAPQITGYNHFAQAVTGAPYGVSFLMARFAGQPLAQSACSDWHGGGTYTSDLPADGLELAIENLPLGI